MVECLSRDKVSGMIGLRHSPTVYFGHTRYALINLRTYMLVYMCTHRQLEKTLGGLSYVHILQRKRERHEIINVEGKYVGNARKGCVKRKGQRGGEGPGMRQICPKAERKTNAS